MAFDFLKKAAVTLASVVSMSNVAAANSNVFLPPQEGEYETVKAEYSTSGPTLIFSDSPEMVYEDGVLYRDTVQGKIRVFFHHVNSQQEPRKLSLLLKNVDELKPVNYTVLSKGVSDKSTDYLLCGKQAQERFFKTQSAENGVLGFGKSVELISGRGEKLYYDQLLTGIVELDIERPLQLSVVMCQPKTDAELYAESAKILPMDEHPLRGTFPNADWEYKLGKTVKADKTYMLKLAADDMGDHGYIKGTDATTNLPAENYGNYGVLYKVSFKVGGDKPVKFIFNPIGGPYAGYGILEKEKAVKPFIIPMPPQQTCIGSTVDEAVELAELGEGRYNFYWSPAGTSSLPVQFFWK